MMEFDKNTKYPVIDLMESQRAIKIKGAPFIKIWGIEYVENVSLIKGSQNIIFMAANGSTPKK